MQPHRAGRATSNNNAAGTIAVSRITIRKLSDDVSVTGQIEPADIEAIAAAGFKALICNRPDDEEPGQPAYAAIAAQAAAHGMIVHHQPVVSGRLVGTDVGDFGRLMATLPKPVLAYCRSGARCTQLFNLWSSE